MVNDSVRLSTLIRESEDDQFELALVTMKNPLSYEKYLVNVGKFRQLLATEQTLRDKLKKRPDEDDNLDDLDVPAGQRLNEDDEQPEPATRRPRARPWGGL